MKNKIPAEKVRKFLEDFSIPFTENGEVFFHLPCPECGKRKAYLTKRTHTFACWVCADSGVKGNASKYLALLTGKSLQSIKEYFSVEVTDDIFDGLSLDDDEEEEILPPLDMFKTVWPTGFWPIEHNLSKPAALYLQERGVSVELAMEYGVRYSPSHRRVCFPIESEGVFLGYQGRLIDSTVGELGGLRYSSPKYLTSKGVPKERALMFYNRLEGCEHAIIAEGPFDAIKLHCLGGNVATIGKAVSDHQIKLIKAEKVIVALDPDAPKQIKKLSESLLWAGKNVYVMTPPHKDFGDCNEDEVKHAFDTKKDYLQYLEENL